MIGRTISHYKVLEKLGEGGMGVVYRAEDTKLERPVALKFLSPASLGTEEEKIRFVREAKAAAALDHPSICTVHEIDEAEGQTFIAMAYLDGESIEEKIKSGPLDVAEAVDTAMQVAEGLRQAHKKGIIHRDIKSANIMLTEYGQAKIMDFGLAKLAGKTRLTRTATIMGTVAYMSPEQAHGETAIDHRTDIWSLGILLYEMLTGRPPFDAPTDAGLIYKIVHEEPKSLVNLRSEIPAPLAQATLKMLQKDPQDRYEDMEALIADLTAIKAGAAPQIVVRERDVPSIVVLPFADMSPAKDQEYFCDGIAEEIINALTQFKDLKVIARTSAFSFKGHDIDVREIGKKLDVGVVLEGSVRKAGNQLRVTAQLVDVAGWHHLWSEKYDRDMEDIFAIQDEISEIIVGRLKPRLFAEEKQKLARSQTVDLEAYDLYLRGQYFLGKNSEEALRKAIDYFEQAIEKAPDYALAYAGLASVYSIVPVFSPSSLPAKEAYLKAREAAIKALEIDENLGEARTVLGGIKGYYDWDYESAEMEYQKAIELNPGDAYAYNGFANYLRMMGRFEEAFEMMRQSLELDPLSISLNRDAGTLFFFARQYDKAIMQFQKTIEMEPTFPYVHMLLGLVFLQKGMHEEAVVELENEKNVLGGEHPTAEMVIGVIHALMGRREKAKKILKLFKETSVPPFMVATLYFALGDNDSGFEWLDKAIEVRDAWLGFLSSNPSFDLLNVRSDPRYKKLLIKMNLEKPDKTVPIIEPSPSIVVLPFVNLSADPEQEYFCDGLAEELINALTQLKDLHVVARTSAFSFKGKEMDVRQIGSRLNVKSVLEGSVRKVGNRLRITAQLVNVDDGYHLWSERYDREMEDIFAIQDDITLSIVDKLKPQLLGEEKAKLAKRRTVNMEAYNLLLQGQYFRSKATEESMKKALVLLEQAVEKAPDYAAVYAEIANCYLGLVTTHLLRPKDAYPKLIAATDKALEIDDSFAEAHAHMASIKTIYEYDWSGAQKEFRRAIELNPGSAYGHFVYGAILRYMGRFDEAISEIQHSLELDPLSLVTHRELGNTFMFAGKYDQAMNFLRKTIEMDPSFPLVHLSLGALYLLRSMYDEAIAELEKEKAISSGQDLAAEITIGIIDANLGSQEHAETILKDILQQSQQKYVPPCFVAWLNLALGRTDQCFEWLDRAYEERDPGLRFLKIHPFMSPLHSDPRFQAMLKKIGLDK